MSCLTRKQYELPKLKERFDFRSMIRNALNVLKIPCEIRDSKYEFKLSFTYPNLKYIQLGRYGWENRQQNLIRVEKIEELNKY